MTKRKLRYSGLGLAVLTIGAMAACSSTDNGTPGGGGTSTSAGSHSGGSSGTGTAGTGTAGTGTAGTGTAGTGTAGTGTAGTGTGGAPGFACANTAPTSALITDFSNLVASTDPATAGNYTFMGGVLGGTFTYQPGALTLSTLGNTALNVKGNVHDYDGFGLYFNTCYDVKTAGYTGISFSVKGNVGPKGKLNFRVSTNANTAIDMKTVGNSMKGQCVATNPADTYPDCHAASFDIPVTATATVINVNFTQLSGGLPVDGVTGADVVGLEWALDWTPGATGTAGSGAGGAGTAGSGTGGASGGSGGASGGSGGASGGSGGASGGSGGSATGAGGASTVAGAYDADVTIDDVKFLGGPPAGGSGGMGAGGASGGSAGASGGSGGASGGSGGASGGSGGKAGSGG